MNLIKILKELISTDHYDGRKKDRVINIQRVEVSKEALGNFTLSQVQESIIKEIQNITLNRLKTLELKDFPASQNYYIGYKFMAPIIKANNKQYPITIISEKGTGTYYYVIIYEEKLITLVLSDSDNFEEDIPKHLERKKIDIPIKTLTSSELNYIINLNKLMGIEDPKPKKVSEDDLPYKVRTDYRINSKFTHEDYGDGKIIATSSGTKGTADSRGMLSWIDVEFNTPFISGGKSQKIKRFTNIYAKPYFGISNVLE